MASHGGNAIMIYTNNVVWQCQNGTIKLYPSSFIDHTGTGRALYAVLQTNSGVSTVACAFQRTLFRLVKDGLEIHLSHDTETEGVLYVDFCCNSIILINHNYRKYTDNCLLAVECMLVDVVNTLETCHVHLFDQYRHWEGG